MNQQCHKRLKFRPDINELYHGYDDGVVLFDPVTSNTTLFNPIVLWLIEITATNEFEQQFVLNQLIANFKNDEAIELTQLLDNSLNSLIELGFIQRI